MRKRKLGPVPWMISFFVLLQTSFPTKIHYDETLTLEFLYLLILWSHSGRQVGYNEVVKPVCRCGPLGSQVEIICPSVKDMQAYVPFRRNRGSFEVWNSCHAVSFLFFTKSYNFGKTSQELMTYDVWCIIWHMILWRYADSMKVGGKVPSLADFTSRRIHGVTVRQRFNGLWPHIRVSQQAPSRAEECSTVVRPFFKHQKSKTVVQACSV
jgi:hypothetical protein